IDYKFIKINFVELALRTAVPSLPACWFTVPSAGLRAEWHAGGAEWHAGRVRSTKSELNVE
ncbi:MAG: hypothetical protein ACQESM_10035, partial [Bacteroidota bacterium]